MISLLESNMYEVIERIDSVFGVITNRLLPAFSWLEEEADGVEKKKLQENRRIFDPSFMDEADVYEDAYHAGIKHYQIQKEMKMEFQNSALTWMFHLFEKSCTEIFCTDDGNRKIEILIYYGLDRSSASNWYTCNKEMRLLANAIKHGSGASHKEAESLMPDLFSDNPRFLSNSRIYIPTKKLRIYMIAMRSFWVEFFSIWWSKNMNGTLTLPSLPKNT